MFVASGNEKVDERAPKFLTTERHGIYVFPERPRESLGAGRRLGLALDQSGGGIGVSALLLDERAPRDERRERERENGEDDADDLRSHAFEYTGRGGDPRRQKSRRGITTL